MGYQLKPGLYHAVADNEVVVLDANLGRYFCLPPPAARAFSSMIGNRGLDAQADNLAMLKAILVESERPTAIPAPPALPLPTSSRIDDWEPSFEVLRFAEIWAYHRLARQQIAKVPLVRLLESLRRRKGHVGVNDQACRTRLWQHTDAFLSSRLIFSSHDQCLRCSLALSHFLARRGLFPDFVIGVRMKPFGAHAWLQSGDMVLNDNVDTVRRFTPIVVV